MNAAAVWATHNQVSLSTRIGMSIKNFACCHIDEWPMASVCGAYRMNRMQNRAFECGGGSRDICIFSPFSRCGVWCCHYACDACNSSTIAYHKSHTSGCGLTAWFLSTSCSLFSSIVCARAQLYGYPLHVIKCRFWLRKFLRTSVATAATSTKRCILWAVINLQHFLNWHTQRQHQRTSRTQPYAIYFCLFIFIERTR